MLETFLVGLVSLLVSYGGVAGLRYWAEKKQILDIPNERSSHQRPTPRGGGLAIVLITLTAWAGYELARGQFAETFWVWGGALLVAVVGWLDDLYTLSNKVRFTAHILSATAVIATLGHWSTLTIPPLPLIQLDWVGYIVTLLWIVGLINAYNFMDGIDGMAGGQAMVAGLGWLFFGIQFNVPLVAFLGLIVATSSLGFLGHNWSPARIFMGDVASGFLGYIFAILPILLGHSESSSISLLIGILLLWPFLFDAIFTFLRRAKQGENVFSAHRSHLYQRLIIIGYSHQFVSTLYMMLASIGFALAFIYNWHWKEAVWVIGGVLICGVGLLWFVTYQEQKAAVKIRS